ncbi:unnamed protein product [Ranitomeya imitator]|uniref:UPAR/Ly6 domain-containing protein n=1 Tax=Ranitomeya imitator TaxID=111125 RepID=A0ABN9L2M8_9NEOB|nr:unnamed protein product [Ranitomeya imitator]
MKMLLPFVVFMFNFYFTGLSLSCVECSIDAATSCNGNVTTCIGAELCMSTITQTTAADGQKTFTFDRYCGDAAQCNTMGSLTSFLSTETNSTCCNKDSCTPPQPTLTKREASENSVQCEVCLAHSTTQCLPSNVRNCTGDEKYCALYKIKSGTEKTVIMGCASESFCRSAQTQKLVNGKDIRVVASCVRNRSDSLKAQVVYLLPLLLGVLVHGV